MQITTEPSGADQKYLEYQLLSALDQKLIKSSNIKASEGLSKEVATSLPSSNDEVQLPQQPREKPRVCMFKDVYFNIGG